MRFAVALTFTLASGVGAARIQIDAADEAAEGSSLSVPSFPNEVVIRPAASPWGNPQCFYVGYQDREADYGDIGAAGCNSGLVDEYATFRIEQREGTAAFAGTSAFTICNPYTCRCLFGNEHAEQSSEFNRLAASWYHENIHNDHLWLIEPTGTTERRVPLYTITHMVSGFRLYLNDDSSVDIGPTLASGIYSSQVWSLWDRAEKCADGVLTCDEAVTDPVCGQFGQSASCCEERRATWEERRATWLEQRSSR